MSVSVCKQTGIIRHEHTRTHIHTQTHVRTHCRAEHRLQYEKRVFSCTSHKPPVSHILIRDMDIWTLCMPSCLCVTFRGSMCVCVCVYSVCVFVFTGCVCV